jgi:hypothetical protein
LPQFVEQPRILDGYHRLGGEVLDQRDLLVGEGTYFLPINTDNADEFVFFEHRHEEKGARAAHIGHCDYRRIVFDVGFFRPDVRNVLQLLRGSHTAKRVVLPTGPHNWFTPPKRRQRRRRTV